MNTVEQVKQEITDAQARLKSDESALGNALATGRPTDALESRCAGLRTQLHQLDLKRDAAQQIADDKQEKADLKEARRLTKAAEQHRATILTQGEKLAALVEQMEAVAAEIGKANAIRDWQIPLSEAHRLGIERDETKAARYPLPDFGGLGGRAKNAVGMYVGTQETMAQRGTQHLT